VAGQASNRGFLYFFLFDEVNDWAIEGTRIEIDNAFEDRKFAAFASNNSGDYLLILFLEYRFDFKVGATVRAS
jgi:hypothetical protein